uniref:Shisa N-terminal domain-containing protein n=1 Tax=Anas zonorhyncha TaxID=75864 RepID=A0A8B9W4P4_9AVES
MRLSLGSLKPIHIYRVYVAFKLLQGPPRSCTCGDCNLTPERPAHTLGGTHGLHTYTPRTPLRAPPSRAHPRGPHSPAGPCPPHPPQPSEPTGTAHGPAGARQAIPHPGPAAEVCVWGAARCPGRVGGLGGGSDPARRRAVTPARSDVRTARYGSARHGARAARLLLAATCWGYYDVSGQWDKEFECNNSQTGFRYCCGTCFYRFCCNKRAEKLNQSLCRNYKSPEWAHPTTASGALPADGSNGADGDADKYDPDKDSTNATVYISCGAIAFVLIAGVFAKVAYDKARRPPREMNIHRCDALTHGHCLAMSLPLAPPFQAFLLSMGCLRAPLLPLVARSLALSLSRASP